MDTFLNRVAVEGYPADHSKRRVLVKLLFWTIKGRIGMVVIYYINIPINSGIDSGDPDMAFILKSENTCCPQIEISPIDEHKRISFYGWLHCVFIDDPRNQIGP